MAKPRNSFTDNGNARLTWATVRRIRARIKNRRKAGETLKEIAAAYGISPQWASEIKNNHKWPREQDPARRKARAR
jgi:predicted transcriptional regulator